MILSSWLIETKLGRKFTVVISFVIAGISSIILIAAINLALTVVLSALLVFNVMLGFGPVFTIATESYDTDVKAIGFSWCAICTRVSGLIAPLVMGPLLAIDNGSAIGLILIGAFFISGGLVGIFFKETKIFNLQN